MAVEHRYSSAKVGCRLGVSENIVNRCDESCKQGHYGQHGIYKVRRLMRGLGLKAKPARWYKITTDSPHTFTMAPKRRL